MKIKRVLQGTALAALAAAAWMGTGSTDASAKVSTDDIFIEDGVIHMNSDDAEIMVSIVQVKNNQFQIKNWDVYEDGCATVDLSKLNNAKDNYVAVLTDDAKPFFLKIAKTDKPGKATYNYKTGTLTFGTLTDLSKAEYRTVNSGWDLVSYLDVSMYNYQGASLYMRVKDTLKSPVLNASEKLDDKSTKNTTEDYAVYDIGSLASKEVKFNVAKQANGPSLSGDYVKNTIKSKDGLPARVVYNSSFYDFGGENGAKPVVSGGAVTSKSSKTADLEAITKGFNPGDKIVLEVRTDATDKKPASKWSRLEIVVPSQIAASAIASTVTNGAIVTSGDAIKVSAAFTEKSGKNGAKSYPDVVIKNDASKGNVDVKIGETGRVSTLKPSKTVKYKKTGTDGNKLYVRVGGDKADKKWAGAWTEIGQVTFPKDVAAATPTPAPSTAAK